MLSHVQHDQGRPAAAYNQESSTRGATDPLYLPTSLPSNRPTPSPTQGYARESESPRADGLGAESFNSSRTDVDSPQLMRARQARPPAASPQLNLTLTSS